jgi:magnesium-transporting ATPase (P-type)
MTQWHAQSIDQTLEFFASNAHGGLTAAQVDPARERHGANEMPRGRTRSAVVQFLRGFNNPIIYVLMGAGILTTFLADAVDSIVIFVVVIVNTVIGYYQETKAEAALQALMDLTAPTARIIRHGVQTTLPATEIVCGDIVLLESGTKVPADLRLVETQELVVDESMFTGESLPVTKQAGATIAPDAAMGDRLTMAYAGTAVQRGRARGVVVAVGPYTELGAIAQSVASTDFATSPLQHRLASFGKRLSIAIGIAIAVIFLAGWLLAGNNVIQMLLTAVGMAVSAIPEGLPVSVTVALSIGVYTMAKKNAVIRRLDAVESLGSTTVICTDKTGTLTENAMVVTHIAAGGTIHTVTGRAYEREGAIRRPDGVAADPAQNAALEATLRVGALCTETRLARADGRQTVVGDPTEGAMLVAAAKGGLDPDTIGETWPQLDIYPFESEHQYMAVIVHGPEGPVLLLKGSVERILPMCDRMHFAGGPEPLDPDIVHEQVSILSSQALRLIATAWRPVSEGARAGDETLHAGCIFAGLQGMLDPPRAEVRDAIADCRSAGIRVIMITGDHKDTARAIAEDLCLDEHIQVVTGSELEGMSDKTLLGICDTTDVYARVSPMHKLRIVTQLQARNHVVTMTGDGVNDAPALKAADIGVAMGAGTDVAKEASSMVVMDNNFASIAAAVRYGRVIFENLRHIVLFVLSTSFGGVLTLAASIFTGLPLPLLPAQLLWINLVTDGISTFPLAFEKEQGDVMKRPPRAVGAGLVPKEMLVSILIAGLVMTIGTLSVYAWSYHHAGEDTARTMAFVTLALFQVWNVHNSRAVRDSLFRIGPFSNRTLLLVMLVSLSLQVLAVELPGLNTLLRSTPLHVSQWLICVGVSLSIIVVMELKKLLVRHWLDPRID